MTRRLPSLDRSAAGYGGVTAGPANTLYGKNLFMQNRVL